MANCFRNPEFCDDSYVTLSDTDKFVTSFFFSVTIGVVIIAIYLLFQLYAKTKAFLEPRIYNQKPHRISKQHSITTTKNGLCARDIAALSDDQLINYIGLDGVVFLLFIKSCIKICLFCTGIALVILIPIYATESVKFFLFLFDILLMIHF